MEKKLLAFIFLFVLISVTVHSSNYYWVGGNGYWHEYATHWATTSGGSTFHTSVPGQNDNVYFDVNSFTPSSDTVYVSDDIFFHDMSWVGVTTNPLFSCASNIRISGSLTLVSNMTFQNSGGQTTFVSDFDETINTGNKILKSVTFNGNGSWTLQNYMLNVDNDILLIKGTLHTNAFTVMCSKFVSTPADITSPRILDIRNSVIKIKSSDNGQYLSWKVDNSGNSMHVIYDNSTVEFRGSSGMSTMEAGCGLHYNDVNFLFDDGLMVVCTDTIRNATFNQNGYVLGSNNIFNNVTILGNGFIGDNSIILPLLPVNIDNNRFNTVDIYHKGRIYGDHNVFNNIYFSSHPSNCNPIICVYCGATDDGELHGDNDTVTNLLSFKREGKIYGNLNVIKTCTYWCDGWVYNGSNQFDVLNLYRHYQECTPSVHANVLTLQSSKTQTITSAFNLLGPYYCGQTFIKSTTTGTAALLNSTPVLTLDYVQLKDIHANNSYLVADTATRSVDISGNSNWVFQNIYQPIVTDSTIILDVHPCFSNSNGQVSIFAHGGIGQLQYAIWITNPTDPFFIPYWSGYQVSNTFSGLFKGNHAYRIMDAYGCVFESNIYIGGPTQVVINSVEKQNITCFDYHNGQLTIHASGGSGNLYYSIDNTTFSTDSVFSGLYPGDYTVFVRDDSLCLASSGIYTITQPAKLILSFFGIKQNAIKCRGDSTGVVKLAAAGGTLPYNVMVFPLSGIYGSDTIHISSTQYNFNFSDNDSVLLHSGHYKCIITDANGCNYENDFEIVEPIPLDIIFSGSNLLCFGDSAGSISINSISGATPPYQYLWLPDSVAGSSLSNLYAGSYVLQITDNNNCKMYDTANVISPPQIKIYLSQDSVVCYGENNGSAFIDSITGGTPSYYPTWSSGEHTLYIQNKPTGYYIVNVSDINSCVVSDSVKILQPKAFSITLTIDSVSCYGGSNGKAKVIVSGGTPPYSYNWINNLFVSISTTDSIFNLPSGFYNLTIQDANLCDTSFTVFIPQPLPIQTSFLLGNTDCFSLSGSWTKVVVSGGVNPYSYQWTNGQTTDSIYNLTAGKYIVSITDANGCIKIDSVIISPLSDTIISNNGCAGANNGTAKVIPIGGSTPYTYIWINNATSDTISTYDTIQNLSPGYYIVIVKDNINCTHADTVEIKSVSLLLDTIVKSDVSCFGGNNGWANCFVNGGAFPYTYQWTSGSLTQFATSLPADTFMITITDNNGCNKIDTVIIHQPTLLTTSFIYANINCNIGDSTGWIKAIPNGGTPPYKYLWNIIGDTTALIDNLVAGKYIVTITDSLLCSVSDTIILTKPSILFNYHNINCFGDTTGWIKATISGGTVPYNYNWNSGLSIADSIHNLTVGNYILTITDSLGCLKKDSITLIQNPKLNITFNYSNNKCFGDSSAWTQAIVIGGTQLPGNTYIYQWNTGDSTALISNLTAGKYIINTTDSLGCFKKDSITLIQPFKLQSTIHYSDVSCYGGNNAWAKTITSGGKLPYHYSWNPTTLSPNPFADSVYNLVQGIYYLSITDSNSCTYNDSVIINQPSQLNLLFNTDSVNCFGDSNGMASVVAFGGIPPYQYLWNYTSSVNDSIFNLPSQYYAINVTDSNHCIVIDSVKVSQPDKLIVIINKTDINCYGGSTGSATANVNGGTPPYNYLWNNGSTLQNIIGLTAGTYWVAVTDANGCGTIDTTYLNQSLPISFIAAPDTLICYGTSVQLTINYLTGGSPPYLVSWLPSASLNDASSLQPIASPLTATNYLVTISDFYNCFASDSITVSVNPFFTVDAGADRTICYKDTILLNANVSGGQNPYYYNWQPNSNLSNNTIDSPIANPSGLTTYTITVTDNTGCKTSDNITATVNSLPVPKFSSDTVCFTDSTHFINFSYGTSSLISTYSWNFGDNTTTFDSVPSHLYSNPGVFNVSLIAIAQNTCRDTVFHTILVDSLPTPNFTFTNACLGQTTYFTNTSSGGGTNIIAYWWDLGDGTFSVAQNPYHFYPVAGNYTVKLKVFNSNGCSDSIQKIIKVNALPMADFISDSSCFGDSLHIQNLSTSSGSLINIWNWNFGDGDTNTTNWNPLHSYNDAGIFYITLLVSDTNGCTNAKTKKQIITPAPFANFSYTQTCLHDTTYFTDLSHFTFDSIVSWNWDFGDGGISTNKNPNHLFTQADSFQVSLKITNQSNCFDSIVLTVLVDSLPVANFATDTVCFNSATTFTDLSESHGSANNLWYWQFGDGNSAYYHNVTYTYDNDTTYLARLIVSNQKGCKDTIDKTVIVNPLPDADFSFTKTCLHDTTLFTSLSTTNAGTTIVSYLWNFGDGNTSILQNPSHIYALSGNYNVKLSIINSNTCADDTIITVKINPLPDINFSYTQACQNDSTHFTNLTINNGTPFTNWDWNFGSNTSVLQNPVYLFPDAGIHNVSLKVTDSLGCFAIKTISVEVDSLPVAEFISDTACFNSATLFTDQSISQGSPINSWYWQFGDGNSAYYHNVTYVYNSTGMYNSTLIVTNQKGCKDTVSHSVFVNHPLNIASYTYTDTCYKSPTYFTSNSTTNPGTTIVSYLWNFGDGTDTIVSLPDIHHTYASPGNYFVKLTTTNSDSCKKDTIITITINPLPDIHFSYTQACLHDTTKFINQTNSVATINSWGWNFGDISSSAFANPTHLYATANTFNVKLIATDALGCRDSLTKLVIVDSLPTANFTFDTVCLHNATHFTDLSVKHGSVINYWNWKFGDGDTSFFQNPNHTYANPTNYTVKLLIRSAIGCKDSTTKTVKINPLPLARFTYTGKCWHDSTKFTSTSIANGGVITSYLWNFGDGLTSTSQNPVHLYASPGVYNVMLRITNTNNCTKDTVIQVSIYSLPVAEFSSPSTGMVAQSIPFNNISIAGSAAITTWTWNLNNGNGNVTGTPNPSAANSQFPLPGNYNVSLIVVDANQCKDTVVHQIMIGSNIVVGFITSDTCLGSPVYFSDTSQVLSGSIISWNWKFGDNTPNSTLQNPSHIYGSAGTYNVTLFVNSNLNFTDSITKSVHIYPNPEVYFTPDIADGCTPISVIFTDSTKILSGNLTQWLWDFSDNPQSTNHPQTTHTFYNSGYYKITLIVTSDMGCKGTFAVDSMIWAQQVPVAGFAVNPVMATVLDSKIRFTDLSTGTFLNGWNWDFGDLTTSIVQNPMHEYLKTGFYWITLTVANQFGCWDSTGRSVWIKGEDAFYAPNAFTPNEDGLNDVFLPLGTFNKDKPFVMLIFNRWGELIFETNSYIPWDGRSRNSNEYCKDGVYIWKISYIDVNGLNQKLSGRVTLIR
jgi:gliding motility-associated-like protein